VSVIAGIGEILWDVFPDAARLGGAPANFACHAAALGDESWIVSAVGTDDLGERAVELLQAQRVCCDVVQRDPHPTGRVDVTLDASRQASYVFAPDCAWDHLTWSDEMQQLAARCDAVCFGSLGQRSPESRATIRRFVQATRPTALRIFDVNLRQQFYDRETITASLELASAMKVNEEELPTVAKLCGIVPREYRQTLESFAVAYDLRLVALTLGPAGALLVAGGEYASASPPSVSVVDTVGAGDAFTATLVHDFLRGAPLERINAHANAVASFVCSQPGATATIPAELRTA
jgi:fructokinase